MGRCPLGPGASRPEILGKDCRENGLGAGGAEWGAAQELSGSGGTGRCEQLER